MSATQRIEWPDGAAFAFTIFDDSDLATLDNVVPVYDLLRDLGLRTTKSVWAVTGDGVARFGGATCDDPAYRDWTLGLQDAGFEIGSHGASSVTSPREEVRRSLDRFREIYGHDPHALANHSGCRESIYWGEARVSGTARLAYNLMTRFRMRGTFRGHLEGDPLFWGDLCHERVRYVRNFTYADMNTLAACPVMPYSRPAATLRQRLVRLLRGRRCQRLQRCLSEASQERLEAEGGACIMYTHFASGSPAATAGSISASAS